MAARRLWDIFCRVIDNYGDAGVCWRFAVDLAARGESVRLWIDDPAPLSWMAPAGAEGVEIVHWTAAAPMLAPGDVVVETFGCDPPADFVARMAPRERPPLWINLEHLSAEDWVERAHGLPSPQRDGLVKWFFFPGFTPATGGLLRELHLLRQRHAFDRDAWLRARGLAPAAGERVVVLFCYANERMPEFVAALGEAPTLLLLTPGHAQTQVRPLALPARVRTAALPWLDQADFDALLWSADLNVVRGEDSFVRAIWAGAPFIWHIYPQHDGAHGPKLHAVLDRLTDGARAPAATGVETLWRRFNGLEAGPLALPAAQPWTAMTAQLRARLAAQDDLVTRLLSFIAGKS